MTDPLLILGTADWNQPIATNQHYVVRELAQAGPVTYVESMGLRSPRFNSQDLQRIARRLGLMSRHRGTVTPRPVPAGVDIRSPRVLPRHTGLARRINQPRIEALVGDWARQPSPLLWTYTPVTYGLETTAAAVVYHCVDLYKEVDGIPADLIDEAERHLARHASVAIGTSPVVVDHLRSQGFRRVEYWPNVADTAVIERARPVEVTRVPRRAVFAGALTGMKIDFALLRDVVDAGFDLHLAGPIAEGDSAAARAVTDLVSAGASYHGLLAPSDLAALYWTCDIGLIPYAINPLTRGVSPLKTYEYLAAGLGVVSTPVPAVTGIEGEVEVRDSGTSFIEAARVVSGISDAAREARMQTARRHTWTERGAVARALLATLGADAPAIDGSPA